MVKLDIMFIRSRIRLSAGITLLAAGLLMFASRSFATGPGDDFNANTRTAVTALQQWYSTGNGLWSNLWWNSANCIEALENEVIANNDTNYLTTLQNTYSANAGGNFLDAYYDDDGWWANAWIRAYDLTGNASYLNTAKTIFANVTNAWSSSCNGGVWWNTSETNNNAVENELFLLAAIRLHQRTPGDGGTGSYLFWATNEWSWFKNSGLIDVKNLVNDGLTANCVNNGENTWTYNQGTILGGLTDLYKATGNTNYLAQAEAIANASISNLVTTGGVLEEPGESGGFGGTDVPEFKGIFARNLAYLYDEDHHAAYYNFLYTNAHSVWSEDRNSSNQLGMHWYGTFDSADPARQSSAIMPLSVIAPPVTSLLFFARPAGDPSFNHATGVAAGTLGWSCNPATAPNPGLMQYGPYLTSLTNSSHVAHFRLAVNSTSTSTASLVTVLVTQNGTTIASASVPWNAFATAGQSQDFPLPFTNTVAGGILEFRVTWNAVSGAPTLTLLDTTIDGAHNWTAANLAHGIGRLDGFNAWEADPVRDPASGYLTEGPGTPELAAGSYTANFELKVDNFAYDSSTIATISVVKVDSNIVVASRNLSRTEFPNVLYRAFPLNFAATAGTHYDFRTYWNFATNAPRLTQRSVVVAPAGAATFTPIALTSASFNQDMVVEAGAPAVPNAKYTTASMDAGTGNNANSWYAQGYDTAAPTTGLPPPGSTVTNQAASDHIYTMPSSYSANDTAMIDSSHSATLVPATPAACSALSFLTAAGHGPVTVDYKVNHSNGTAETGTIVVPDWFFNVPIAWDAQGRVDVTSGAFNNVNAGNPHLYSEDIALTNTASPVSSINLSWDSGNTGSGLAAFFALSGTAPLVPPFNLTVTPLLVTQYVGTAASFLATANGSAPLAYQWQKNGSPIAGATASSLVLSNVSAGDAASYACVVSNLGGSLSTSNAVLTVQPLPSLAITFSAGTPSLTWSARGTLLSATNLAGPWITNQSASSPYPVAPAGPSQFFRLLLPVNP